MGRKYTTNIDTISLRTCILIRKKTICDLSNLSSTKECASLVYSNNLEKNTSTTLY